MNLAYFIKVSVGFKIICLCTLVQMYAQINTPIIFERKIKTKTTPKSNQNQTKTKTKTKMEIKN